jgi:peroxiredoxin Q/BCP
MVENESVRLQPGDQSPELCLPNQDNKTLCLDQFIGCKVVLYFYPKDLTPGCTTQAAELTEILPKLKRAGYVVLGVSPDSPEKHKEFIKKINIGFELLSDPNKEAMSRWGTYGKKVMYGRESVGVIRSTFVIDETGVITKTWYGTKATGHASRLARELKLDD